MLSYLERLFREGYSHFQTPRIFQNQRLMLINWIISPVSDGYTLCQMISLLTAYLLWVACSKYSTSYEFAYLWIRTKWINKLKVWCVVLHNKKGKCKPSIISKLWIKNRALLPTFHINKSNCLHNTHAVLCGAHVSTRILFGNPFNNKFTVSVDTVKVGWEKQVREQHKCLSVT